MSQDDQKRAAALQALEHVKPGMRLGIGTGSTADFFTRALGEKVAQGLDVIGVPTSERTHALATELNIPLTTLEEMPELDLTIDGADEADGDLNLIKGGGGALLREKIVATASARMVVIADESKLVETLGKFPLPVEVVPFGLKSTRRKVVQALIDNEIGEVDIILRGGAGDPYVTGGSHYILDCHCSAIPDASALANALEGTPGVVDHGLFIAIADTILIAGPEGTRVLEK